MKKGLTYDDMLLVPQYSDIRSRLEINLKTDFGKHSNRNRHGIWYG